MSISNKYLQPALSGRLPVVLYSAKFRQLGGVLLIAGIVFWIYWPALGGGFIWDDELLITSNKLVLSSDGLDRMWFTREPVDYWPVTNSSFWGEWRLWGMNTSGYHVTNVVLHIASALLLWMILRRLEIPGAFLAALLFAVHPINVESVAWIAQRKNTLSLFFSLLSLWWFLNARRNVNRWLWLSLVAFTLAMLSKGSVAVLPFVFLVIVWWRQNRLTLRDGLQTAPFFVVAIVLTAVNIWFQTHGSHETIRDVTPLQRLLGAGAVVWFYLYKALLPIHLAFVYPQWKIQPANLLWWFPLGATVSVTLLLWWQRRRDLLRPLFVAWLIFCLGLLPVMGLVDVYFMKFSLVADHYLYTSLIVVMVMITAAWEILLKRQSGAWRQVLWGLAALVGAGCCGLVRHYSANYADALTLYQASVEKNPHSSLLQNNLGMQLFLNRQANDSIEHFQEAVNLQPDNAEAINNLGLALANIGRTEQALVQYQAALNLRKDFPQAHNNLGLTLAKQGNTDVAIAEFQEALRLNSFYPQAYYNLANSLEQSGQLQKALVNYRLAIQYDPYYWEAENAWAAALMKAGDPSGAIAHYQQSLRLKPDSPEIENNLASALIQTDQPQLAIEHLQQALRLRPDYAAAQHNLGLALAKMGRFEQAISHYESALRLKADFPAAENNLGTALRESGQLQQALVHYQKALEQNPNYTQAYANMAIALAQLNRPSEAIASAQKGLAIALALGQTQMASQIEAWLEHYRLQSSSQQNASQQKGTSQ
jgi:tetratricopeptide (TPR) repeat protein